MDLQISAIRRLVLKIVFCNQSRWSLHFPWFSLGHHLHHHPLVCEARWPCQISGPCQPCHRHITRTRTHHLFEFETTYSFVLYRIASLCTYLYPCLAPVLWFSFHILLYWYPVLFYSFRQAWWPSGKLGFAFFALLGYDTSIRTFWCPFYRPYVYQNR